MEDKTLSYGEKAVGLSFNPSGDPDVQFIKETFAKLVDFCDSRRKLAIAQLPTDFHEAEKARLFSIAITEAQGAQMWAVKAVTWKD